MSERRTCSIACAFPLVLAIALIMIVSGAAYAWLGSYNVGADASHWSITSKLLEAGRERSIVVHARSIAIPKGLDELSRITNGAGLYDEMCTGCHLTPGVENSELRRGLYPEPPNLPLEGVDNLQATFWVIKHGIKLTAMPAWGDSHTDEQIWDMVAFLQQIKGLTVKRYRDLVATATREEEGHAHEGHGHGDVRSR